MVAQALPSTGKVEAEGSEHHGHPEPYKELQKKKKKSMVGGRVELIQSSNHRTEPTVLFRRRGSRCLTNLQISGHSLNVENVIEVSGTGKGLSRRLGVLPSVCERDSLKLFCQRSGEL